MSKPDPPAPPDYIGAAKQQGAANVEAARVEGKINNPNIINPYGTQITDWNDPAAYQQALTTWDAKKAALPSTGGWRDILSRIDWETKNPKPTPNQFQTDQPTVTQTLSPEQQALYLQQVGNQQALGSLGKQGIEAAQGIIGSPLTYGGAPPMPGSSDAIRQRVYDAMMSRVNEDLANKRSNLNADLVAAGIRPGSQAYDTQANLLNRQQTDAQMQALLAGGAEAQRNYGMDLQSRQQALAEQLAQRQVPLNEITALMSGSQVSNPFQIPGYAQNAQVAPPPLFNAAQQAGQYGTDVYNAQMAGQGNLMSGLFGLGGAGLLAAPGLIAL